MNVRNCYAFRGRAFVLVCLALLTACGSVPNTEGNSASQSGAAFSPTPPKPGLGAVYIGRPMTFHTSVFAVPLEVDGKPLASLGPDQYARLELPPGHHEIAATNNAWSRAINGVPHPVGLNIEAGKIYYLLPTRWEGERRMNIVMINNIAIPSQTAVGHSGFSVEVKSPNAAPPADFRQLSPAGP